MTWKRLALIIVLGMSLLSVLVASAEEGGTTYLYSAIACKDSATVTADVYSSYATSAVRVSVYYLNEDGEYKRLSKVRSAPFGAGTSRVKRRTADRNRHSRRRRAAEPEKNSGLRGMFARSASAPRQRCEQGNRRRRSAK